MRSIIGIVALSLIAAGCAGDTTVTADPPLATTVAVAPCAPIVPTARVDIGADGNRVSTVSFDLAAATERRIALPGEPMWVLADPSRPGGWFAILADGTVVVVDPDGATTVNGSIDPTSPPSVDATGTLRSLDRSTLDDPLPDTRVVTTGGLDPDHGWDVWLAGPTDRYGHGVLGDRIEASAIVARHRCTQEQVRVEIPEPDVIEGLAPIVAPFDDAEPVIVATLSNANDGARLVAWDLAGDLVAESEPIGRGNRWRNQLAIAPVGPGGERELVDVRTPHLGGIVEYFRLDGDRLVRVAASESRYTSHWIGSRNVDAGIVFDADADGASEVVVATSDRRSLAVLDRTADGVAETGQRAIGGLLSTNLAPGFVDNSLALGVRAGELVIFEQP